MRRQPLRGFNQRFESSLTVNITLLNRKFQVSNLYEIVLLFHLFARISITSLSMLLQNNAIYINYTSHFPSQPRRDRCLVKRERVGKVEKKREGIMLRRETRYIFSGVFDIAVCGWAARFRRLFSV